MKCVYNASDWLFFNIADLWSLVYVEEHVGWVLYAPSEHSFKFIELSREQPLINESLTSGDTHPFYCWAKLNGIKVVYTKVRYANPGGPPEPKDVEEEFLP